MSENKEFTVTYLLDKDEQAALKSLNQKFREYVSPEGKRPFADQTEEQVFDYIMNYGSKNDISGKIGFAMVQMGMISIDEWLSRTRSPVEADRKAVDTGRNTVNTDRKRRSRSFEPCFQ